MGNWAILKDHYLSDEKMWLLPTALTHTLLLFAFVFLTLHLLESKLQTLLAHWPLCPVWDKKAPERGRDKYNEYQGGNVDKAAGKQVKTHVLVLLVWSIVHLQVPWPLMEAASLAAGPWRALVCAATGIHERSSSLSALHTSVTQLPSDIYPIQYHELWRSSICMISFFNFFLVLLNNTLLKYILILKQYIRLQKWMPKVLPLA